MLMALEAFDAMSTVVAGFCFDMSRSVVKFPNSG